jgi:hypothetical protein
MNKLLKFFVIPLILSFVYPISSPVSAQDVVIDEGWVSPDWPLKGYLNVTFQDASRSVGAPFLIQGEKICSSLSDPRCSDLNKGFEYFTRLGPCENSEDLDCIESVTALIDTKTISGKFVEFFPLRNVTTYQDNPSQSLPKARSGSIWEFPTLINSAGEKYFVNVTMGGKKSKDENSFAPNSLAISVFGSELIPIKSRSGSDGTVDDGSSYVLENKRSDGSTTLGRIGVYGPYEDEQVNCVMSGDSKCLNRKALPKDVGFSFSLRLSKSPSGWFHGRIKEPNISINNLSNGPGVKLSISGGSLQVPTVGFSKPWATVDKELQDKYLDGSFGSKGCRWCSTNPLEATTTSNPPPSGEESISELTSWLPKISDKSSADINTWSVRTLDSREMNGANRCFTKTSQLNGIVTSNSTVYSAGPPRFDGSSLNYKVAAPHLMSDGSVKRGIYTLLVKSDVARCVYGFTAAPIKASVSVINDSGVNTLATTTVSERDNWLQLSAYNFTFSAPTIKVSLSQAKNQRYAISCVKGKVTKKVTGTKPKCPAGFKIKTN